MNLRYCILTACDCKETRHPEVAMKALGITYSHATPQSVADQWWFWNCCNVPDAKPPFLSELALDPLDGIGFGLTEQESKDISKTGILHEHETKTRAR